MQRLHVNRQIIICDHIKVLQASSNPSVGRYAHPWCLHFNCPSIALQLPFNCPSIAFCTFYKYFPPNILLNTLQHDYRPTRWRGGRDVPLLRVEDPKSGAKRCAELAWIDCFLQYLYLPVHQPRPLNSKRLQSRIRRPWCGYIKRRRKIHPSRRPHTRTGTVLLLTARWQQQPLDSLRYGHTRKDSRQVPHQTPQTTNYRRTVSRVSRPFIQ